ncbi:thiamine diphosphokinase [Aerococcaceae bacterium DSM 111020]|nr:thiamine diphosphokinase [Aerococcaceae bacterium DSM 111020]
MSSNNQSAIIICAGAPQPYLEHLHALYPNYQQVTFIGVDRGALALIESGYTLDYAIGDFDSVTEEEYQNIQQRVETIERHPSAKDDTDLELALTMVQERHLAGDIYIYGGLGTELYGRMDHLIANIWMIYQPRFYSLLPSLHFIEKNHQLAFYRPGHYGFAKQPWADYFSVISLTPVKKLTIKGAEYELAATDYAYPRALISNQFKENQAIQISFEAGMVMVMYVKEVK